MRVSTVETWLGPFTVVVDADGAVLAAGWTSEVPALLAAIHPSLRNGEPARRQDLGEATRAVLAYHDGDLHAPDAVPVRQHSDGAFLTAAWTALREVGPGAPITYSQFAARTGDYLPTRNAERRPGPTASRAAALACARNAAALFVPCHRVVRADGTLGGFRWGVDVKKALLQHENVETRGRSVATTG